MINKNEKLVKITQIVIDVCCVTLLVAVITAAVLAWIFSDGDAALVYQGFLILFTYGSGVGFLWTTTRLIVLLIVYAIKTMHSKVYGKNSGFNKFLISESNTTEINDSINEISLADKLRELKKLVDEKILDENEFAEEKRKLMESRNIQNKYSSKPRNRSNSADSFES